MIIDNEEAIVEAYGRDLHRAPFEVITMDLVGIKSEVTSMIDNVDRWAQGEAPAGAGFIMGTLGKAWLRKEPLGVALIIGAWNFPLYTLLAPAVGAIAAGNCVMLKPSEQASAVQELLVQLCPKYLDQSAIQVVTGGAQETGYILEHKFDHIFYTGGSKVGRIIATAAARHLTPTVLELGGQAPAIITKNANIDLAAKRIVHAKLTNSGQICLNVNHVFSDPAIHDELVDRMIFWMKKWVEADREELTHIISDAHFDRILTLLNKTKGTINYTGQHDSTQKFIYPTIISDVTQEDSLLSEELFASLIPVIKADISTAISTINSMPHPLGLYIFSSSQPEIDHILNSTTSGGVTINDVSIHAAVPNAPFGGVGESGYGAYHGKCSFEAFSHTRTVVSLPTWLDSLSAWRYRPFKMENRKNFESFNASFKRGETMQDQKVGSGGWFF